MITKLSGDAEADAIEKAYCKEEIGKTEEKKPKFFLFPRSGR